MTTSCSLQHWSDSSRENTFKRLYYFYQTSGSKYGVHTLKFQWLKSNHWNEISSWYVGIALWLTGALGLDILLAGPQFSKHQLENPPESGHISRDSDHSKVSLFLWKFSKNTSFNMRIPLKTRFEIYENQLFVSDFFLDR